MKNVLIFALLAILVYNCHLYKEELDHNKKSIAELTTVVSDLTAIVLNNATALRNATVVILEHERVLKTQQ